MKRELIKLRKEMKTSKNTEMDMDLRCPRESRVNEALKEGGKTSKKVKR